MKAHLSYSSKKSGDDTQTKIRFIPSFATIGRTAWGKAVIRRPTAPGAAVGLRSAGCPDVLVAPGSHSVRRLRPSARGEIMQKWNAFQKSTVVRVVASSGTVIALAAIVGAGWKWI